MIKLVKQMNGKVHLLAISADDSVEDINIFLKSFPEIRNENISVTWDQDHSLMQLFDVARLPESFVLDRNGKLVKKVVGTINWYTDDSISFMKDLTK
jgi:hypothetical protein